MGRLLKLTFGLAAGAIVGIFAYRAYKVAEDNLRLELVEAVRKAYSAEEIEVVWLFDEPVRAGVFSGGLVLEAVAGNQTVEFEIEEKTLLIRELGQETIEAAK